MIRMGRRKGISETPYRGIVEAINNISDKLLGIKYELAAIKSANNTQTKYLELIARKYNKKLFKRYFGKKKK